MIGAARAAAALGYPVFPLQRRSKVPFAGTKGFLDATLNDDEIVEIWKRHPDANIGLSPAAAGVHVVDLDPKHGVDPDVFLNGVDRTGLVVVETGEAPQCSEKLPDSLPGVVGLHLYFAGDRHPHADKGRRGA